jgi:LmbE family N-acetylglucosaminyl deacetylase
VPRLTLSGRVVIVSPHLDDAVLSLGATIARATRGGTAVTVLTVFGGDPASTAPPNGWDRRGGFETAGDAASRRREENRAACAIVGAKPVALPLFGGGYGAPREPDAVRQAVTDAAAGVDALLVPGFPLTNDDHRWLHTLLVDERVPSVRLVLYAEQPYRHTVRRERPRPDGALFWQPTEARLADVLAKRRAILAYRSQLPLLGLSAYRHLELHRMLLHEVLHHGEAVAELAA